MEAHEHAEPIWESPRTHPALSALAAVIFLGTIVGMLLTWGGPSDQPVFEDSYDAIYHGHAEEVWEGPCADAEELQCRTIDVILDDGPHVGKRVTIEAPITQHVTDVSLGEALLVGRLTNAEPGFEYSIADRDRIGPMMWLGLIFVVVVIALGRLRGFSALVALGISALVLLTYLIPALLRGSDPLLVSMLAASAIAYISLYLSHGFNGMATVALLGTLGGLAVTATLALAFTHAARLTGFATEEAFFVEALGATVDLQGLLLAGMIIAGLGVIDDATLTQSSAVWELAESDPGASRGTLVTRGLRIGRSHVASMVNTLVLAYAGAAMPVLVIAYLSSQSTGVLINSEAVASEIVRTLVGSIGLVLAVPITTLLAAQTVTRAVTRSDLQPGPPPARQKVSRRDKRRSGRWLFDPSTVVDDDPDAP